MTAEVAAVAAAAAATTAPTRSLLTASSPYRMSVTARGAQINLGFQSGSPVPGTSIDPESRRASSNVSQVSLISNKNILNERLVNLTKWINV